MADISTSANSVCGGCGETSWLIPLHGEKGGPLRCYVCAGEWNAKYTRRRKWGRIIIKAMKMFEKEGGSWSSFDKMKIASFGFHIPGYEDTIGAEVGDLTIELLGEVLQLVHPDRHPPEREDLARRVTQELTALRPFLFPAPNPVPPKVTAAQPSLMKPPAHPLREPKTYPCELCAESVPYFYCYSCRAEWDKRQAAERAQENAKVRARRARQRQLWRSTCSTCGQTFKPKRRDAGSCSAACRQRAHRIRVADKQRLHAENIEQPLRDEVINHG